MPLQPRPRRGIAGRESLDQAPEPRPVVHLSEVSDLVRDHVVHHLLGCEDQPPAEGEVSVARAASPSAFRVAHAYSHHIAPYPGRKQSRPEGEFAAGGRNEMIADSARNMRRVTAYSDFAIDDGNRGCRWIGFPPDTMRGSEYRHDCAFGERNLLRQRCEPSGDPSSLGCEKAQTLACRNTGRQNQLDPALSGIDPQRDPPCSWADPDGNWRLDIQRLHLCVHAVAA